MRDRDRNVQKGVGATASSKGLRDREMMLTPAEALATVLASANSLVDAETVAINQAERRVLASDIVARRTQPPFAISAMDGYAVRAADLSQRRDRFRVVGVSAAGHGFRGTIRNGEAVRISTGAPVPEGADGIVIQENAHVREGRVSIAGDVVPGRYIRPWGFDFHEGDTLLKAGMRLDARRLALAAAMGHASLAVRRKPRVGMITIGDELVSVGQPIGRDQIVAANSHAVAAIVHRAGGEAVDLGIVRDDFLMLKATIDQAQKVQVDILVTLGGASVGEHDLAQQSLVNSGMEIGFWKIAMRPGKPLLYGRLGSIIVLGLPGNPVSSVVCAILFLRPLVAALSGDLMAGKDPSVSALLGSDLPANDERQDYLRAALALGDCPDSLPFAIPLDRQDSSLLSVLARADALLVRPPHAPVACAGELCRIIRFDHL
jgi:molybdopterin molybdotransferase